jgi:hypothetical protein
MLCVRRFGKLAIGHVFDRFVKLVGPGFHPLTANHIGANGSIQQRKPGRTATVLSLRSRKRCDTFFSHSLFQKKVVHSRLYSVAHLLFLIDFFAGSVPRRDVSRLA